MAKQKKINKDKLLDKSSGYNSRIVPESKQHITMEKLKAMMPRGVHVSVTEEILDKINSVEDRVGLPQELFEQDLLAYTRLLGGKGRNLNDLINAITFCNLKRNMAIDKAWRITFPDKAKELDEGSRDSSSFSSMYNGTDMVREIDKAMILPVSLLYNHTFHMAVQKTVNLMNGIAAPNADGEPQTVSAHVQHLSAKALMDTLKPEEDKTVQLEVGIASEVKDMYSQMIDQISVHTALQKERLAKGESISEVQKLGLKADVIDVEVDDEE